MQDGRKHPRQCEPSERQLREMLERREQEKDAEWRLKSSKVTGILAVVLVVLGGAIMFFPESRNLVSGTAKEESPEIEAAKEALIAATAAKASGNPDGLDSFRPKGSAEGGQVEDIRFVSELFQFLRFDSPPVEKKSPVSETPDLAKP